MLPLTAQILLDFPLEIHGSDGSVLDFTGTTVRAFNCRDSITVVNLEATNWSSAALDLVLFDFTEAVTQVPYVEMNGCYFHDAPDGFCLKIDQLNGAAANTVGIARGLITGCRMDDVSHGLKLETSVKQITVVDCKFRDIEENAVWLGRDLDGAFWDTEGDYIVDSCQFERIGDGSVQSDPDRHAVIAFGLRAVVSNCTVDTVDNDTHSDCEAIYFKVREAIAIGNTIHNGGRNAGAIIQKGKSRALDLEKGWNTIFSNNVIQYTEGRVASAGLSIGVGEAIVEGNLLDGCTSQAIIVGIDDMVDVMIRNNRIVNCGTSANPITGNYSAISIDAQNADISILGNYIGRVYATANSVGITLSNSKVDPINSVTIADNTITEVKGGATSLIAGILNNISLNPGINYWVVRDNIIEDIGDQGDDTGSAINMSAGSPRFVSALIESNMFANIGQVLAGSEAAILNLSGTATTQIVIRRNRGFVSERSGIAAFPGGGTTLVVNHGLDWEVGDADIPHRLAMRIRCEWVEDPGANVTRWWVSTVTATQFTFNTDGNTSANFAWDVIEHTEPVN